MKLFTPICSLVVLLLLLVACGENPSTTAMGDGNAETHDAETTAAIDDMAEKIKHGAYMVQVMGCSDCHTPLKMTDKGPAPDMDRFLSGHPSQFELPPYDPAVNKGYILFTMTNTAAIGPWGTSFSANLTPDDTGIGTWTEEQFSRALREGKSKGMENGRPILPPMPWQNYIGMKDEDLSAVFAYLKSIKPVENQVPAAVMAAPM